MSNTKKTRIFSMQHHFTAFYTDTFSGRLKTVFSKLPFLTPPVIFFSRCLLMLYTLSLSRKMLKILCFEISSTSTRSKIIFPRLCSCFLICFVLKVAGTQLYDWSLQGYIAVESLWKDNPKKKKSGKKSDKVSRLRNLISGFNIAFLDKE